jgi:hypothetical protein
MSFEFTKRNAEVLKRALEVYKDDFQKDFELKSEMESDEFEKERDEDGDYIFNKVSLLNDFYMSMEIEFNMNEDEPYIDMSSLKAYIEILHETSSSETSVTYTRIFRLDLNKYKNDEWVDTLIKTYEFCKCKRLVYKDGFCKDCYPYVSEQEDVCCCCLENKGVWIKIDCGHLIHRQCFSKIENEVKDGKHQRKCPLCRQFVPCWQPHSNIV